MSEEVKHKKVRGKGRPLGGLACFVLMVPLCLDAPSRQGSNADGIAA